MEEDSTRRPETEPLNSTTTTPGMEVYYVVISRKDVVLAEYTRHSGNFEQVSRVLLRRINEDGKNRLAQLRYDAHVFHYSILDGLTYMCMTDESAGNRRPFNFLTQVSDNFRAKYGSPLEAIAYEFNQEFSPILRQIVEYHLTNIDADTIGSVKSKIDATKEVMVDNIEKLLERGERIELLVNKTEQMTEQAFRFERQATKLKTSMCCKKAKFYLFLLFVFALIAAFVAVMACGINFGNC